VSGSRNYLNELYILKSYPLMKSVIDDLDFDVAFYLEGNFLTSEAYEFVPVKAKVLNDSTIGGRKMTFRIIDETHYELSPNNGVEEVSRQTFRFNDTIRFLDLDMVFEIKKAEEVKKYVNTPFILLYTSSSRLTGSYVTRVSASWAEIGAGVINLSMNGPNPT